MRATPAIPCVLSIAGSDPTGGAGLQADLRVFAAHGVHGLAVPTAITVQDTHGVVRTSVLPASLVADQLTVLLADVACHVVKIGMLGSASVVRAVAGALRRSARRPVVVLDPVLRSSSYAALLGRGGLRALREDLLPLATLITPNLPEASELLGYRVQVDAAEAASGLLEMGAGAVLVKGGHGALSTVTDVLAVGSGRGTRMYSYSSARLAGGPFHGTGCALSAAIASRLARGEDLPEAVSASVAWTRDAIAGARRLGAGSLLLNLDSRA